MRIAFITLGFSPFRASGLDLAGERLVKALLSAGHLVTVIAGRRDELDESFHYPALTVVRIPLDSTDWIGFGYRAARILSVLAPFDVVHFWDIQFSWAFRGRFIASLQHSFRQRLFSLGSYSIYTPFSWMWRYLYYSSSKYFVEIPSIHRSMGLLAGSATTWDEYINNYDIPPDRIALVPHGIDTEFFQSIRDVRCLRQHLNLIEGDPVIMYVGFITPRKGLDYLAQALPMINPTPRIIIAGRWRNEKYRRQVMKLLEPVRENVIEVGFIRDEEMPAYYSLCDVYVSSSLMEGFGLPLAEALACETPVVAVDAGAVAEVIGPGGILVPARQVGEFADAVSILLQNATMREEMGRLGRGHIQKNFSVDSMLQATLDAYKRFC